MQQASDSGNTYGEPTRFEHVIDRVGGFGRRQFAIFMLINFGDFITSTTIMGPVFFGATPRWTCPASNWTNETTHVLLPDSSTQSLIMYSFNETAFGDAKEMLQHDSCTDNNEVCSGLQYVSDFTSIVSEWDLICGQKFVSSIITTLQMAGLLVGAFVISQLADSFGRKPVWYAAVTLSGIISFSSTFSPGWQVFGAMRFFTAMCSGGLIIVNFVWALEFCGTKWRTLNGAIGLWVVGVLLLTLLAYTIRDWKIIMYITSLTPSLISWSFFRFLPESPRWLAMKGRLEEAKCILDAIAKNNKKEPVEMSQIQKAVEEEKQQAAEERQYSFWDLFRTPQLSRYNVVLMFIWFVQSSTYYGLSLNVNNMPGNVYTNTALLAVVDLPVALSTLYLNNRVGRRITYFGFMLVGGCAIFSVMFIAISGQKESLSTLVTVLALVGKAGVAASWIASSLYAAELAPTVIRNIAFGTVSIAGRIGGIVAPQFQLLNSISMELPYIVFGGLCLAMAFLGLLTLPETRNRPLPDALPEWSCCGRGEGHVELAQIGEATKDGDQLNLQIS
ncbi:organic cation transporter protein [Lingula anatina]|uniref:Organic cation transporter protein n=1 Tax=Lingula anatina TaxID=7574 RepID=A0A1S3IGB2_LINAN|nr:organic cation transporter protein [Lingula anatina]|eukprot:XP_013397300.1 organic cation transporter protein [Lingula anatina]